MCFTAYCRCSIYAYHTVRLRLLMMQLFRRSLSCFALNAPARGAAPLVERFVLHRTACLQLPAVLACASLLLCVIPAPAFAQQQTAALRVSGSGLPEEPQPQSDPQGSQTPSVEGSATVSGVVLDESGASVTGAQVSLMNMGGLQRHTLMSGANGEFSFTKLPPGSYVVVIDANGLEPFRSAELVLTAQQTYDLPKILLPIATANTSMLIRPTDVIAAEQVKAEEKQRVFGIIPNFYTSYVYDAAPLTRRQKYSLAFHDTFDPVSFIGTGVAAGIEQANNSFAGYGQGAAGYGKRYAASFGDGLFSNYLSHAVLASLFHQDPRYFYQGSGSNKSRLEHAVSFAVILRSDSGRSVPNYSSLLGDLGAGALSNLYYPHADRGPGLVFTNTAISIGGRAAGAIIREFLSKYVTTNVPGNGKP